MSLKHDQAHQKDPFAVLSQGVERIVKKKHAHNSDDDDGSNPAPQAMQAHDTAEPPQSRASSSAAAVLMSHWSDQKSPTSGPIDTLTGADRQNMINKRKKAEPQANTVEEEKAAAPPKEQSVE